MPQMPSRVSTVQGLAFTLSQAVDVEQSVGEAVVRFAQRPRDCENDGERGVIVRVRALGGEALDSLGTVEPPGSPLRVPPPMVDDEDGSRTVTHRVATPKTTVAIALVHVAAGLERHRRTSQRSRRRRRWPCWFGRDRAEEGATVRPAPG
jgi:hypothetical protein